MGTEVESVQRCGVGEKVMEEAGGAQERLSKACRVRAKRAASNLQTLTPGRSKMFKRRRLGGWSLGRAPGTLRPPEFEEDSCYQGDFLVIKTHCSPDTKEATFSQILSKLTVPMMGFRQPQAQHLYWKRQVTSPGFTSIRLEAAGLCPQKDLFVHHKEFLVDSVLAPPHEGASSLEKAEFLVGL